MEAYKKAGDMGNNRQVLKDNISKDLHNKIESTKQNLIQLKAAIQTVDKNSAEAKNEVTNAVDTINQQLLVRKLELTKQIDLLCHVQKISLQEGMHTAYMRLGNLQSTLSNLDSFDNSQLLNLHVPETLWRTADMTLPTPMETELGTAKLTEELSNWGKVSSKSSQEFLRTSPSTLQRTSVEPDVKSGGARSGSVKSTPRPLNPLFPSNMISETTFKKRDSIEVIHKEPKDWQIEQWLSGMKIQNINDADDFEMLSDAEPRKNCDDSKVPSLESMSRDVENCDGEDGSSIVCVETEELSLDDMSKWLKPKKKRSPSLSSHGALSSYLLKSKSSMNNNQNQLVNHRYLDFPCLRLDPNSWVQKRKKNVLMSVNRSELCLQVGQKEIIPPTYALPYPFWLKKY